MFASLFVSMAGKQLVNVDKIKLESVVPNSQPETFINVRGTKIPVARIFFFFLKDSDRNKQTRKCFSLIFQLKNPTDSSFLSSRKRAG